MSNILLFLSLVFTPLGLYSLDHDPSHQKSSSFMASLEKRKTPLCRGTTNWKQFRVAQISSISAQTKNRQNLFLKALLDYFPSSLLSVKVSLASRASFWGSPSAQERPPICNLALTPIFLPSSPSHQNVPNLSSLPCLHHQLTKYTNRSP